METYTRHIEVRDLPIASNNLLNTLARIRGIPKWKLVREALVEYVERHKDEINIIVGTATEKNDEGEQ